MLTPAPDIAGRIVDDSDGRRHLLPVRVYFEDTDFSGLVYHASYLRWCERGRSDFLRLSGIRHAALHAPGEGGEPAAFAVRRMSLEFLKPARIDDIVEVGTRVTDVTKATLTLDQSVRRGDSLLFTARVLAVLVSASGRALRLPAAVSQRLGRVDGRHGAA